MKKYLLALFFLINACSSIRPSIDDEQEASRLVDQGITALRSGALDQAEANFKLASELTTSAAAIDGLGCIAFIKGDLTQAEELFWRAYEADSTYNNSLANLALVYERRGELDKASKFFKRALNEDSRNFKARNNYSVFLASQHKEDAALENLYKAQALFNHPIIYANIDSLKEKEYEKQ